MGLCSHLFAFVISQWAAMNPPNGFPSEDSEYRPLQLHTENKQWCSVFRQTMTQVGAGVATCCAVCCCCPLAILDILVLGLVKTPYQVGKKSFQKLKKKSKAHRQHSKGGAEAEAEAESLWFYQDSAHWEEDESTKSSASEYPIVSQALITAGGLSAGYTLTCHCRCAIPRIPDKVMHKLLLGIRKKLGLRKKSCSSTSNTSATTISLSDPDADADADSTPLWSYGHDRSKGHMTGYDSDFGPEWYTDSSNSQEGIELDTFWDDYFEKEDIGFWRPNYSCHND
eukprot:Gb_09989 [translate_table: standard]